MAGGGRLSGMNPSRSLRRSAGVGVASWLAVVVAAFLAGLLLGVWSPSDVTVGRVGSELSWFALVGLSSLLVVGLPVAGYLRFGLVVPLGVSTAYVAYFAWFGATTGAASTPFVALLYSWIAAPAVVRAAVVEGVVRRFRRGGDEDGEVRSASP